METAKYMSQLCQGINAEKIYNLDNTRKMGMLDSKGFCHRCGRNSHLALDCRFKEADCNSYGKKGNIAKV